jgi:hypothetical protein
MLALLHLGVIALFVLLGAVFSRGKGSWLIAGYNTAPPAEKARYDQAALCRFMGRFMLVLALCWLPIFLSALLDCLPLLWVGLILFLAAALGGAIYANTGRRFKQQPPM